MSDVREGDPLLGHFDSDEHALATGMILGALHKAMAEDDRMIRDVRPFMEGHNYTKQILVQVGGKHYTITVEESTREALRE